VALLSAVLVLVMDGHFAYPLARHRLCEAEELDSEPRHRHRIRNPLQVTHEGDRDALLGASPANQAYRYLIGNPSAIPSAALTMIVVAGFGEEILFRGYLFERLGKLLGQS